MNGNPYAIRSNFNTFEAACAIAGIIKPTREHEHVIKQYQRELEITFPPTTARKFSSRDSITGESYYQTSTRSARIPRADLLAWCEARNIRPSLLFPDPPPAPSPEPERPLHESERATLLKIIRALAELHGVKQTDNPKDAYRSEATRLLQKCSSKGIADPCTDKSLAKHLKAAFDSR